MPSLEPSSPLSPTSLYFTTSEPKAKFLTRYSQDMNQFNVVKDTKDLNQKKVSLDFVYFWKVYKRESNASGGISNTFGS